MRCDAFKIKESVEAERLCVCGGNVTPFLIALEGDGGTLPSVPLALRV